MKLSRTWSISAKLPSEVRVSTWDAVMGEGFRLKESSLQYAFAVDPGIAATEQPVTGNAQDLDIRHAAESRDLHASSVRARDLLPGSRCNRSPSPCDPVRAWVGLRFAA